jgi:hypothetical protein
MVKDSKKYASTGGWKFAQFDEGKPLEDEAKDHLARKRHSSAAKPMLEHTH